MNIHQPEGMSETQLRIDLAAAFRLAAELDMHEAVANHFSLAVSADGKTFLMNPRWKHFSRIKASDLLLLNADDKTTMNQPDAPDPSAWAIHGTMHAQLPQARCILHVHSPYATALACLADPDIKPVDQNTARYFNRMAIDLHYGGIADDPDEAGRLVRLMGNKSRMMMGNHGVLVTAPTVAEAFDDLYYLERACAMQTRALAGGQRVNIANQGVPEKTAGQGAFAFDGYMGALAWPALHRKLERMDPSYKS